MLETPLTSFASLFAVLNGSGVSAVASLGSRFWERAGSSDSIRTIAHALGKSEDAIKANLYRMRRALVDGAPGLENLLRQ